MRPNHALALMRYRRRKDFTTATVAFNSRHGTWGRPFTYKVLRDFKLKAGDTVVVVFPTSEFGLGKVVEVHAEPQITGTEPWDFKWIVQKVDPRTYMRLTEEDIEFNKYVAEQDTERLLQQSVDFMKAKRLPRGKKSLRAARGKK